MFLCYTKAWFTVLSKATNCPASTGEDSPTIDLTIATTLQIRAAPGAEVKALSWDGKDGSGTPTKPLRALVVPEVEPPKVKLLVSASISNLVPRVSNQIGPLEKRLLK